MPRPKRPRAITVHPPVKGFRPSGSGQEGEVILSLEEFEAIRLVDFEGMDQTLASVSMKVSRQTFGRVLKSGRFNLAKALVKGFQLKVKGGCYEMRGSEFSLGSGNKVGRTRRRRLSQKGAGQQRVKPGGEPMIEDTKMVQAQDKNGNPDEKTGPGRKRDSGQNQDQNQGQGRRQGRGTGGGCGRGGGQGRGRGLGGGKGDGSCRRS